MSAFLDSCSGRSLGSEDGDPFMTSVGEQTGVEDDRRMQSAEYIADLTSELAKLARQSRLDVLAYLLDIASLEAKTSAGRLNRPAAARE